VQLLTRETADFIAPTLWPATVLTSAYWTTGSEGSCMSVCTAAGFITALQLVYRAAVVARLTYVAIAWRRLTKTSDRQRINSVIDRARRLLYCSPDLPTLDELCDIADDELFGNVVLWLNHVLHTLLPPTTTTTSALEVFLRQCVI